MLLACFRLGRHGAVIISLLWLLAITAHADKLTIYHVGVGQGDATIILALQANQAGGTDTAAILIDAGNSSGKGTAVVGALQQLLGARKKLDLAIVSHLHSDHLGGMAQVLNTLRTSGWKLTAILDRGVSYVPLDDECYSPDGYVENDPIAPVDLPGSSVYGTYVKAAQTWGNIRFNLAPGNNLFSLLGRPNSMSMFCVASNALVLDSYYSDNATAYAAKDENDYSYAFLLDFQGFQYFTGGDIGGGGGGHGDGETPLAAYFSTFPNAAKFHFCDFKVSHHGSGYSTNEAFINRAWPTFVVIPSALRSFSGTQIPTASTISTLQSYCQQLFTTYVYTSSISSGQVSNYIDVVLEITDPGYDKDIPITVSQAIRSKTSPYGILSTLTPSTITCGKPHPAPDTGMRAASLRPEPTQSHQAVPRLRTVQAGRAGKSASVGVLPGFGRAPAGR